MQTIEKSITVPYSVEKMYDLVNDLGRYSEFLPWCQDVKIHSEAADEVTATLCISKGAIQQQITTVNKLAENTSITMQLKDGPFKSFEGAWKFSPLDSNSCQINLDLNYSFGNALLSMTAGGLIKSTMGMLTDAFAKRADELYG